MTGSEYSDWIVTRFHLRESGPSISKVILPMLFICIVREIELEIILAAYTVVDDLFILDN